MRRPFSSRLSAHWCSPVSCGRFQATEEQKSVIFFGSFWDYCCWIIHGSWLHNCNLEVMFHTAWTHNYPYIKTRHIYLLCPKLLFRSKTLISSNYGRDNASQRCFYQKLKHHIVREMLSDQSSQFGLFPLADVVQSATPSPHYRMVHFDVSGVDLTNSTLVKAEFRIFRAPNPQARASEQRVEIYQVTNHKWKPRKATSAVFHALYLYWKVLRPDEDSTSTQRYIDSRTVQLKSKGGWISVDVTETIKDWVSDPGQDSLLATLIVKLTSISWSLHFVFVVQRITWALSWASTVPAARLSPRPTTLFRTRARSWRPFLQVCSSCFHLKCQRFDECRWSYPWFAPVATATRNGLVVKVLFKDIYRRFSSTLVMEVSDSFWAVPPQWFMHNFDQK